MMDHIDIRLTHAEAVVLHDFLNQYPPPGEEYPGEFTVTDPAVVYALGQIGGQLESTLVEPFMSNYTELVA